MFYSSTIFVTKGKLAPIWLAANWEKKLTKKEVHELSVRDAVRWIITPSQPLALRLSGKLLMGVVRLWQRKMAYLHEDCNDALRRIKKTLPGDRMKKKGGSFSTSKSMSMVSKSDNYVRDLFSDMPTDLGMMSVEEMLNFMDEGNAGVTDTVNQARAQDIQLDEDIISSFDLAKDHMDDGSSMLLEDQDGDHPADHNSNGYSLLMDALKHDINYSRHNYPVEKGKNLGMNFEMNQTGADHFAEDDDDIMQGDSDNDELPSKENLSVDGKPVSGAAVKDYSTDNSGASFNSSGELKIESGVLREQGMSPNTMEVEAGPSEINGNERKRRKPQTDQITELANEIISAQLRDTSNIVWNVRPYADLSDRSKNVYGGDDLEAMLLKPVLPGYAPELVKCYENCWRKRKRVKLNPDDESMDTGCSISARRLFNQSKSIFMDCPSDEDQGDEDNPLSDDVSDLMDLRNRNTTRGAMTTPRVFENDGDKSDDDDEGYVNNSKSEENAGWSTRTQKMLQYLTDKEESDFVYQEMVKGKARITAVGFFYELLVLKTHVMIDLKQEEAYGKIDFSKTNNITKSDEG